MTPRHRGAQLFLLRHLSRWPSAVWQALLYGSRDTLVSPGDANTALRLVARALGKDCNVVQFSDSGRANALLKMLNECFGGLGFREFIPYKMRTPVTFCGSVLKFFDWRAADGRDPDLGTSSVSILPGWAETN
jgi:hypothetical protein